MNSPSPQILGPPFFYRPCEAEAEVATRGSEGEGEREVEGEAREVGRAPAAAARASGPLRLLAAVAAALLSIFAFLRRLVAGRWRGRSRRMGAALRGVLDACGPVLATTRAAGGTATQVRAVERDLRRVSRVRGGGERRDDGGRRVGGAAVVRRRARGGGGALVVGAAPGGGAAGPGLGAGPPR